MAAARVGRAATAERRRRPLGRRPTSLLLALLTRATASTGSSGSEPHGGHPDRTPITCVGPDAETHRIVSLVPAVASTLEALGLTSCLVGRALDDRTASVAGVPVVGTVLGPDVESILATEPTMVFTGPVPAATRLAAVLGQERVTALRLERLDDAVAGVRVVADRAGRARGRPDRGGRRPERVRGRTGPLVSAVDGATGGARCDRRRRRRPRARSESEAGSRRRTARMARPAVPAGCPIASLFSQC